MARIKHSGLISDIRGSIDNLTFAIQKAGVSTVRQKANVIANPASSAQAAVRCSIASLAAKWMSTLTPAMRALWNTYALTKPGEGNQDGGILTVIKGNGGIMSGFNAYLMANQWLLTANLAAITTAPVGVVKPTPPTGLAATWTTPNIVLSWDTPGTKKAGAKCRIWMNCHQQNIHRQLIYSITATEETMDIGNVRGANGIAIPLIDLPGEYIIQMDTIDTDGTKSGPSQTVQVIVT